MALTLPYPDITFVPLDVLTADELNHIVANYTAISNIFPITAQNIAAGAINSTALGTAAVTTEKIYWHAVGSDALANKSVTKEKIDDQFIYGSSSSPSGTTASNSMVKLWVQY